MIQNIPQRLLSFQGVIVSSSPQTQSIEYDSSIWNSYFPNDADIHSLISMFPSAITRKDIKLLSAQAIENSRLVRKLFLATMIWGFGKRGYGPYRTNEMLDTPSSTSILHQTVTAIVEGNIKKAYETLQLSLCGPVFSTKFLYFIGLGAHSIFLPVILDARVAESLDKLNVGLSSIGCFKFKNGIGVRRSSSGYIQYVNFMNSWAKQINCKADAIEYFLFNPPLGF